MEVLRDGDANRREAMMSGDDTGVVVPADPGGRRSSSVLGRAVVADALRGVDAVGALGAEHETNWRRGYTSCISAGFSRPAWPLGKPR